MVNFNNTQEKTLADFDMEKVPLDQADRETIFDMALWFMSEQHKPTFEVGYMKRVVEFAINEYRMMMDIR